MTKYRKKPVEIEAMQWDGSLESMGAICNWANSGTEEANIDFIVHDAKPNEVLDPLIHTLEGDMRVAPHDYVIRGVQGEFYACKPDIFEATYEPVE